MKKPASSGCAGTGVKAGTSKHETVRGGPMKAKISSAEAVKPCGKPGPHKIRK